MSDNPSNKHPLLVDLEDKLELVETLWGGTAAMRDAGTEYLPKEPGEESANYANRLARTVLFPAYKEAVKTNTGKLYIKDVVVNDPSIEMEALMAGVDEENNSVTEFSKGLTESAIHQGCSYILVDYPVMNQNSTLRDEREMGGRPYWVKITQDQVLEASPVMVKGKKQLGVFRFEEMIAYRDGQFTVKYMKQIKQLMLTTGGVMYSIFRKNDAGMWVLYDEGTINGVDEIPVAAANVNSAGFFIGSPMFYDLAEENVLNWQMRSDYNNIVHHSQVPMLQVNGVQSSYDENGVRNNPIVISPNTVLEFNDPQAGASWIEVSGDAAEVGANSLKESEMRMGLMSLELLSKVDSKSTATAAKIDAMESFSVLQSVGMTVEQAIEKAIDFTYKYIGTPNPGTTATINLDDAVVTGTTDDIDYLLRLYDAQLLTKETTLGEVKRRGMISDDVNVEEELAKMVLTDEDPIVEPPLPE